MAVTKKTKGDKMSLMLLQESLWNLEDKLNVIMEGTADHEAELIRLKQITNQILARLSKTVSEKSYNKGRGGSTHA